MDAGNDLDILTVTTTVAAAVDAENLARELVESRLAACVQVEAGLKSFYRWDGQRCEEAEVRLTIKTIPGKQGPLQAFFAQRHPYEVPQFLGVTMRASAAYAAWVRREVS